MPDKEISPGVFIVSDDQIKWFPIQVDTLLDALGHPEALVTDESTFGDFIMMENPTMDQHELDIVMEHLGLKGFLTLGTTLLDAAKLLAQRENPQ